MATSLQFDWLYVREHVHENLPLLTLVLCTAVFTYLSVPLIFKPSVPTISVPLPPQAQRGWSGPVLEEPSIFGKDPSVVQCYCPATGQLIGTVKLATPADVDAAIARSKAAQLKWRNTTFKQRAQVLRTLLKFILDHQEDIARVACRDSGVAQHFHQGI